jgi:hypothetical protein
MMRLDMTNGKMIYVIEPGNIKRMKEGFPLIIAGNVSIVFTPDMEALSRLLIDEFPDPGRHGLEMRLVDISDEKVVRSLEACQNLPEVVR